MKITDISDIDLKQYFIFNPNNLPLKKFFIHKNWAIVLPLNALALKKSKGGKCNKIIINSIIYKFCSHCNRFHPLSNFYNIKRNYDGKGSLCIECEKDLMALKYMQNRDYYLIQSRLQYLRICKKLGFPKDKRRKENKQMDSTKKNTGILGVIRESGINGIMVCR